MTLKSILITAVFFSTAVFAAEQKNQFQLPHIDVPIKADGAMDESVWSEALMMELKYENRPGEGLPAPVKTEMYLYENGQALHVAFKAFDPNPENIRASLRDRDALWRDDNIGIIIDTFNDERSGYEFFVNPLGAQADMRMDDSNGWDEDDSWDAIWESGGQITDFGYVVEMVIPFSALRFPEHDGPVIWNIAGWRNYPRDVRHQMATYKNDRNLKCSLCQFDQIIGFETVKPSNNFQLTPTLTMSRFDDKPEVPGDWDEGDIEVEPGLDIRWGITQDIVLNATLNPDFSQVEADASQLDVNNTFSLFYPEKRPFFLDGASYFDTTGFNFVHTRNIAEPDVGLKLTGKNNGHSYGVLVANDNNTNFLIPGAQGSDIAELERESELAIARYKMDVGERNSVGVLVTHRTATNYHNTLASIDSNLWLTDADSVRVNFAFADSKNPEFVQEDFEVDDNQQDHAVSLRYDHNTRDYNLRASYRNVGEDFRSDLGFTSKVDYEQAVVGGRYTWYGENDDWLNRWGVFGDWDKTYDQSGKLLEEEYEIHGNLQGKMQFFSNFGVVTRERFYDEQYFDETQFMMFAEFTPIAGLDIMNFFRIGDQIDFANTQLGDVLVLEPRIRWDANQHIKLDVSYNFMELDVDQGRLFTANQVDFRLNYQFNMRSLLKLVIQYTDIDRNADLYQYDDIEDRPESTERYFSTQLIYSYKINPQTLFFIGYSDGGFQDDNLDSLERDQRSIFTKFSYAWQL
ncbi:carbohydrate binding family 9 domain-containing protein [Thalassotalea sp. M1531]|uniref:Carbohydrate binding family 9 domain-containing protein n=1 Tax=Thalassotalea algicola TaxID=2716224 RepID=A0A7Y0L9B3_9GAMM|nr:carbohydrate binding family 9 domain-containing protein [Thalassotalea algicola]NMP30014.1 carbohydrate binding family 9 domain-containing protein [Thalassotalea algicola]